MKFTEEQEKAIQELNLYINVIQELQKTQISPLEKRSEDCLKMIFPNLNQEQINDWLMDVIYNDPDNAFERMIQLYGENV
jgi:hypothetical protein